MAAISDKLYGTKLDDAGRALDGTGQQPDPDAQQSEYQSPEGDTKLELLDQEGEEVEGYICPPAQSVDPLEAACKPSTERAETDALDNANEVNSAAAADLDDVIPSQT